MDAFADDTRKVTTHADSFLFLKLSKKLCSLGLIVELQFPFTVYPTDNSFAKYVTLDGFSLLFNSLIQTHIFIFKKGDLVLKILHIFQFGRHLFTAQLIEAIHIGLHSYKALIVFVEILLGLL